MSTRVGVPYRGGIPGYATCAEVNGQAPVLVVYNRGGIVYSEVPSAIEVDMLTQRCSGYGFEQNFEWGEPDPGRWETLQVRSGRLESRDTQSRFTEARSDCIRLRLRSGERHRITLRSDAFDSFLAIHRGSCTGEQLWQNDDLGPENRNAQVVVAGEVNLFARIQPSRSPALGAYELLIEREMTMPYPARDLQTSARP